MSKRINVILPDAVLDRVAAENLKESLKQGYLANAARDLEIAQEWFHLEEEVWEKV